MNRKIIFKKWLYFVVERFWQKIYTYFTTSSEEEAKKTLDFINSNYE